MESAFRREDVLKINIDNPDIKVSSTNNRTLQAGSVNCHSVNTDNEAIKQKFTLLALPTEIRIQIYDILLVSRFDREQNPSWAVGKTYQKLVMFRMIKAPQYRTMEPTILQTCKQIYHEAVPILYSRNVFAISAPGEMFNFMAQSGLTNFKLVRSLQIWVPWQSDHLAWITLLATLSDKATGLRFVELAWDADVEFPWPPGAQERGLGDNVFFVRALARIKQLEELKITGYYAKNWPSYLRKEMSAQLHVECGHPINEDEEDEEMLEWMQDLNEENLQKFKAYQEGTENIIP